MEIAIVPQMVGISEEKILPQLLASIQVSLGDVPLKQDNRPCL